jgi:hypothetical protein
VGDKNDPNAASVPNAADAIVWDVPETKVQTEKEKEAAEKKAKADQAKKAAEEAKVRRKQEVYHDIYCKS